MPSKKVNTAEAAEQTHAPISHQHQQFVDAIVRGATPTDAYMEVFPGTTRVSAYNSSSRLLKKPEIWQRVSDGQMAAQLRRQQQAREHIIEQLTRIEARLLTLADIIDGRWQHKDTTINKDTGHVIERYRSDPKAALQAIKLEMKLEEQRTLLREQLNTIDSQMQNTSEKEELETLTPEEVAERYAYCDGRTHTPQISDTTITEQGKIETHKKLIKPHQHLKKN